MLVSNPPCVPLFEFHFATCLEVAPAPHLITPFQLPIDRASAPRSAKSAEGVLGNSYLGTAYSYFLQCKNLTMSAVLVDRPRPALAEVLQRFAVDFASNARSRLRRISFKAGRRHLGSLPRCPCVVAGTLGPMSHLTVPRSASEHKGIGPKSNHET